MKVKFEYERIYKKVDIVAFHGELRAFCDFMMTESYHGPILEHADRLYKDRAFVALLHKWAKYNKLADDELACYKDLYIRDRDSLAWIIAEML